MKNVKDLSSAAKTDASDLSNRLSSFKGDIKSAAEEAGHNIREYYDRKRSELGELTDDLSATVRSKPIQSTLVAAAIGFILGKLLSK